MSSDRSEQHVVPAGTGTLVRVPAGSAIRITDLQGSQVADFFAVTADRSSHLSARVTRAVNWRLFPQLGQSFFTEDYRPLFVFEADTSPGVHDMLAAPCSADMYRALGWQGAHHANCSDNFRAAAATVGWSTDRVPDPVDFFQNTPVGEHETVTALPSVSRPGDSVTLRALLDVDAIVSACAMDLADINGGQCTDLQVEVLTPAQ